MAKKRITLPKDFKDLLKTQSLEELKSLFDKIDLEAKGDYNKCTALAFDECPHELAKWLVEQGANIEEGDRYGNTPLQNRAFSYHGNIPSLIELGANVNVSNKNGTPLHIAAERHIHTNLVILLNHGADIEALMKYGYGDDEPYTPLELTLRTCNNIDIEATVEISKTLLNAGAKKTKRMKQLVTEIGEQFEFYRDRFNTDHVDDTVVALHELYKIFEVEPVPMRLIHDGVTPIEVKATTWKKQHAELWELLVPGGGQAMTVQGEVIRITGRVARELLDNGGMNWDADYRKMVSSFYEFVQQGNKLTEDENTELAKIVAEVKVGNSTNMYKMTELGVKWVMNNLTPIKLESINYDR